MGFNRKDLSNLQIQTKTANVQKSKPAAGDRRQQRQRAGGNFPGSDDYTDQNNDALGAGRNAVTFDSMFSIGADFNMDGSDYEKIEIPLPGSNFNPRTPPRGGTNRGGPQDSPGNDQVTRFVGGAQRFFNEFEEQVAAESSRRSSNTNDDIMTIPGSNRDVYLASKHGLTSLYPVIISSHTVNNDLATIKKFIDLNVIMKRSVEQAAITTIQKFPTVNDSAYTQNMDRAKAYLTAMCNASISKDRVILSLSPYQINLNAAYAQVMATSMPVPDTSRPRSATFSPPVITFPRLDGEDYVFLGGKPLDLFLSNNGLGTNFSNTQAVLQLLKMLTMYISNGFVQTLDIQSNQSIENASSGDLSLEPDRIINDTISNFASLNKVDYYTDLEFSLDLDVAGIQKVISVVAKDLIIHSRFDNIKSLTPFSTSGNAQTVRDVLIKLIGSYGNNNMRKTIASYEIINIKDFISANSIDVLNQTLLRKDDNNKTFPVLDVDNNFAETSNKTGVDYLIYDELANELENVTFDNLSNFSLDYGSLTQKIMQLVSGITPNDNERYFFVETMCNKLADYLDDARLTTSEAQGYGSGRRTLMFFLASQSETFAKLLFAFLCTRKNGSSRETQQRALSAMINANANGSIYGFSESIIRSVAPIDGVVDEGSLKTFAINQKRDNISFENAAKDTATTSFDLFHNIVDDIETSFSEYLANNQINQTTRSLSISRDGRALVVYLFFLKLMRTVRFRMSYTEGNDVIMGYTFFPEQFVAIRDALRALKTRPENYESSSNSKFYHSTYVRPLTDLATQIDQNIFDVASVIDRHAGTIFQNTDILSKSVENAKLSIINNNLRNKETLLHSLQLEQNYLKTFLLEMHSKKSTNASYVPASNDYTIGQSKNLKSMIDSGFIGNNQTTTNILTIGLTAGLLEDLRYKSMTGASSIASDLFEITLTFKDLQEKQTQEVEGTVSYVEKKYLFSSGLRVTEGSTDFNGADTKSDSLTDMTSIFKNTALQEMVVISDSVAIFPINYENAISRYSKEVVDNEIRSYYADLLLRSTIGLDINEQYFPVLGTQFVYPDFGNGNYSVLQNDINSSYITEEISSGIFATRIKREIARSRYCAPNQLFDNVATSKTFDKIINIVIDVDNVTNNADSGQSFSFENVMVDIRAVDRSEFTLN